MTAKRKTTTTAAAMASNEAPATAPATAPADPRIETTETMVKETMEKTMKTAEDFLAFGQGNMDALVKASQIWATGVQDISKQVAATAQASFDESMAAFKALSAVKTPKDALEVQANLARTSVEKAVAETGKLTDASLKLAEQAMAPITARVNMAVEQFAKVA